MEVRRSIVLVLAVVVHACLYVPCGSKEADEEQCGICTPGACQTTVGAGVCRCDDACEIFGDCCGSVENKPDCNHTLPSYPLPLPPFQCRDLLVEESGSECAFQEMTMLWIVQSCPPEWSGTTEDIECRDNSLFYPVTDLDTGFVYANEQCALCNSVSDELLHWKVSFQCNKESAELQSALDNNTLTLELIHSQCSHCSYKVPSIKVPLYPRPCYIPIASCKKRNQLEEETSVSWFPLEYNELVSNCTSGDLQPVQDAYSLIIYRNYFCAVCNGVDIASLRCATEANSNSGNTIITPNDDSFNLVLDVFGDGHVTVESTTSTFVAVICPESSVFDPVLNDCRLMICPEGFVLVEGACRQQNLTNETIICSGELVALNGSDYEIIAGGNNMTLNYSGLEYEILKWDEFGHPVVCLNRSDLSCPAYIVLTVNDTYTLIDNDTVSYGDEEYTIAYEDENGQPVICSPFSVNGTQEVNVTVVLEYSHPAGFAELSYIGCSFSVLGCILVLLTYTVFKELRTLPSVLLMNLATAILINDVLILAYKLGTTSHGMCVTLAVAGHFAFLSQFSWMSIVTFEMGRMLNRARKLAQMSEAKYRFLAVYMILGWSIPLLVVLVTVIINFTADGLVLYGESEDGQAASCWINHIESALLAIVAPIVVSVSFNAVALVFITVCLFKAWMHGRKMNKVTQTNVPYFRVYLAIVSVTGLVWLFGLLAILVGKTWAWYPYIIFTSFQGFTIFIGFLATKKIAKLYFQCLNCNKWFAKSFVPSTENPTFQSYLPKGIFTPSEIQLATFSQADPVNLTTTLD